MIATTASRYCSGVKISTSGRLIFPSPGGGYAARRGRTLAQEWAAPAGRRKLPLGPVESNPLQGVMSMPTVELQARSEHCNNCASARSSWRLRRQKKSPFLSTDFAYSSSICHMSSTRTSVGRRRTRRRRSPTPEDRGPDRWATVRVLRRFDVSLRLCCATVRVLPHLRQLDLLQGSLPHLGTASVNDQTGPR